MLCTARVVDPSTTLAETFFTTALGGRSTGRLHLAHSRRASRCAWWHVGRRGADPRDVDGLLAARNYAFIHDVYNEGKILKDKVVLVTGSTMGIGRAVARLFLAEGAAVIVTVCTSFHHEP